MNGNKLKEARKKKGYTQVSLADALHVSKGSVAMWETGKRNPEFATLENLLTLLDVSYDYLTGKSPAQGYHNSTDDNLKQIAAWAIADDAYDIIKMYLSLDSYGQSAVESLIKSEKRRCIEQKTDTDTSAYKVQVLFDKNSVQV